MKYKKAKLPLLLVCLCAALFAACQQMAETETKKEIVDTSVASIETLMPERVRTVFSRSCESCHGMDGHGIVGIAPDFRQSAQRSPDQWQKYFNDPKGAHPGGQMPTLLWLNQDEIKSVAEYLSTLHQPAAAVEGDSAR